MKWVVAVLRKFDAAHRLIGYPGDCSNVHGHTWKVEVAVETTELDQLGMGIDFKMLKKYLDEVLSEFDHAVLMKQDDTLLTDVSGKKVFLKSNPTAEVIASEIFGRMKEKGLHVRWVKVWESDDAYIEYTE
jgi:6-pyruvoyltetrahydropterin/6-carboxytetrahydropterin synthase